MQGFRIRVIWERNVLGVSVCLDRGCVAVVCCKVAICLGSKDPSALWWFVWKRKSQILNLATSIKLEYLYIFPIYFIIGIDYLDISRHSPRGNEFLLGGMKKFFSPVGILRFAMLPTEVFGNLFRREFGFAHVAEISGKVNGFSWRKKRKKEKINERRIKWTCYGITSITQPIIWKCVNFFIAHLRFNGTRNLYTNSFYLFSSIKIISYFLYVLLSFYGLF